MCFVSKRVQNIGFVSNIQKYYISCPKCFLSVSKNSQTCPFVSKIVSFGHRVQNPACPNFKPLFLQWFQALILDTFNFRHSPSCCSLEALILDTALCILGLRDKKHVTAITRLRFDVQTSRTEHPNRNAEIYQMEESRAFPSFAHI